MSLTQLSNVSDGPDVRHIDGLWEVEEAAAYLRCSVRTLWRRVNEQGLPSIRIGRKRLFRRSEIDAWITERNDAQREPEQKKSA